MNNFYNDFLYKKDQLEILKRAYSGIFKILISSIQETDSNNIVSQMLTYKRLAFQRIDITDALYLVEDLLNDSGLAATIGITPDMSMVLKKKIWSNTPKIDKARLIDEAGYSISLTSFVKLPDSNNKKSNFNIVDFEVIDMHNNALIQNIDYFFYDNKLIILKEFSMDETYSKKFLILKNIVIDTNIAEDKLGRSLNIPYSEDFTKTDYVETLKGFTQAAAEGPKIKNLEIALGKYKMLEGIKIIDKKNAGDEGIFWKSNQYGLSPFEFLILIPENFISKADKLNYVKDFFKQIKPSYSNYVFVPSITSAYDRLDLRNAKTYFDTQGSSIFFNKLNAKNTMNSLLSLSLDDKSKFLMKNYGCIDGELFYDHNATCDILIMDGSSISNLAQYKYRDSLKYSSYIDSFITQDKVDNISYIEKFNKSFSFDHKDIFSIKKDSVFNQSLLETNDKFDFKKEQIVQKSGDLLRKDYLKIRNKDTKVCNDAELKNKDVLKIKKDNISNQSLLIANDKFNFQKHHTINVLGSHFKKDSIIFKHKDKKICVGPELRHKDVFKNKKDEVINNSYFKTNDKINVKEADNTQILNDFYNNDKINKKECKPKFIPTHEKKDTLLFSKVQNIIVCDKNISCDDISSLLILDKGEYIENSSPKDFISIELIPKK